MSKTNKAIAALSIAASLGMAAAPMATFATSQTNPRGITDTLSVTIEEVCAFGYTAGTIAPGSHTDGSEISGSNITGTQNNTPTSGKTAGMSYGKWDSGTLTAYDIPGTGDPEKSGQTAYGVMETGTNNPNFASTTMTIVCNNADGYQLTATPSVLTGQVTSATFAASGYSASATSSSWGYKFANATSATNANTLTTDATDWNSTATAQDVIVETSNASNPTDADGDSFTVTYGVSVATNAAADTYVGSIDYLLAEL